MMLIRLMVNLSGAGRTGCDHELMLGNVPACYEPGTPLHRVGKGPATYRRNRAGTGPVHRFGLTSPQYRPSIAKSWSGSTSIGA